jgi:hypothetical protein
VSDYSDRVFVHMLPIWNREYLSIAVRRHKDANSVDLGALRSNMSVALERMGKKKEALEVAQAAVVLRPTWAKVTNPSVPFRMVIFALYNQKNSS